MQWLADRMGWIWSFAGVYLLVLGLMFAFQRSLMYPASSERPDLDLLGIPGLREIQIETADGLTLFHGYRPPLEADGPVVVAFHGNAGNIAHRAHKFRPLLDTGVGMLLMEYRGYAGNPGSPTEADLVSDGRGVLTWLAEEGVPPERTLLYGESLGTGLAVQLAAWQARTSTAEGGQARPYAGVMLEAPFTSTADVAQRIYWFLPARWLLLDQWDSSAHIGAIDTDLLVIHGEHDRTVSVDFGRTLFAQAEEPKDGLFLAQGDHNNLWDLPEVQKRVFDFVRAQVPQAASAEGAK